MRNNFLSIFSTKHIICFVSLLSFSFGLINAQNIITIAGDGNQGYSGNGGPANSGFCEFNNPTGLVIDKAGNIYIVDSNNNVIRKINTNGIISVFAGIYMPINGGYSGDGGPATDAEINEPGGICIDASGNIFIADYNNDAIREINTSGIIFTVAGNGFSGYSGDGGIATAAELHRPEDIFVDKLGNIFITDFANCRIREVNTAGYISTIAGIGVEGYSGDGGMATAAEISYCYSLGIDSLGNILVTDGPNNRIRKVTTSGIISTIAGNGHAGFSGDGGAATAAEINYPFSIYIDNSGNIIFSDADNYRIRKIDNSGNISTLAGNGHLGYTGNGGPATAAEVGGVWGIYPDSYGNICFADAGNNVVRKIVYSSAIVHSIENKINFSIYPNPATEKLFVICDRSPPQIVNITISDITGRELIIKEVSPFSQVKSTIDVSSLSSGIYFITISSSGNTKTMKFIKQ